jgi:hypothetical protein
MSQYAAVNGKPVLQYHPPGDEVNNVEDIIGVSDPAVKITFTEVEALVAQADRLIGSPALRRSEGEKLRRAIITPEQFASRLRKTIETGKTFDGPTVEIDYSLATERYMALINRYGEGVERWLAAKYKLACVWLFPKAAINFAGNLPYMLDYLIRKAMAR